MKKNIGQNIVKHKIRFDLEIIASIIRNNSKVLDIGCGDGELLQYLNINNNSDARGIELSSSLVSQCLAKGLSVIQGDAENDLSYYPDNSFDYAILSHTIQATHRPDQIIEEMVRVANCAIISMPNFAHINNRLHLLVNGTMPVNETIPFQWYETPNIHFCSINDFKNLCRKLNLNIKREIFLTEKKIIRSKLYANLFARYAIFVVVKNELGANYEFEFANKALANPKRLLV